MSGGGIYIHVPYCRNKCLYCDFYSGGLRIADWDIYLKALFQELDTRKNELTFHPSTLYIGGGTPSLMPVKILRRLTEFIRQRCKVEDWKEFTIEVNPEDVTPENCMLWKECGVNRISLGIQSLNNEELKKIGRNHSGEEGQKALDILMANFDNISVDIMFGLPGQTADSYRETLSKIISHSPSHISSYSLMLESGTAMTLLYEKGQLDIPDEESWLEMFNITNHFLASSGYRRYEVSNYALEGFESLHNTNYWLGKPYLGLGPSAHSYDGIDRRRANPNDIKGYLKRYGLGSNDLKPLFHEEILSEKERKEEMIMTRLRMTKGLNLEEFSKDFGEMNKKKLLQKADVYVKQGLMKEKKGFLIFTDKGFIVSNPILSDLF